MDSDSPIAPCIAGQPTLAFGNGNLFTAMRTFKPEFGDIVGATDWLASAVAPRPTGSWQHRTGVQAGPDASYSYRRSADGDGRYRRSE